MRDGFLVFKWMPRWGDGCWRPVGEFLFATVFHSHRSAMRCAHQLVDAYPDDPVCVVVFRAAAVGSILDQVIDGLPPFGGDVDYINTIPCLEARHLVAEPVLVPERLVHAARRSRKTAVVVPAVS